MFCGYLLKNGKENANIELEKYQTEEIKLIVLQSDKWVHYRHIGSHVASDESWVNASDQAQNKGYVEIGGDSKCYFEQFMDTQLNFGKIDEYKRLTIDIWFGLKLKM